MSLSVILASFGSVVWGLLAVVLVLVCLLLIVVILIQNPKGGGLTSAFGAGPGGDSLFGAKAQKDVTLWTGSLTFVFLGIVFVMVIFDPDKQSSAGDTGAGPRPDEIQATTEDSPEGVGALDLGPGGPLTIDPKELAPPTETTTPPTETTTPPAKPETPAAPATDGTGAGTDTESPTPKPDEN